MGPTGSEGKGCQVTFPHPGLCLSPALEAWISTQRESRCEEVFLSFRGSTSKPA